MRTDDHSDCPLTPHQQTRNVVIYAINWGLIYLASPATYVGVFQANLLKPLGFGDTLANLPAGVYLLTTPLAVLVVWYFPQVRHLKPLLVASFLLTAAMAGLAAAVIVAGGPLAVLAVLV